MARYSLALKQSVAQDVRVILTEVVRRILQRILHSIEAEVLTVMAVKMAYRREVDR